MGSFYCLFSFKVYRGCYRFFIDGLCCTQDSWYLVQDSREIASRFCSRLPDFYYIRNSPSCVSCSTPIGRTASSTCSLLYASKVQTKCRQHSCQQSACSADIWMQQQAWHWQSYRLDPVVWVIVDHPYLARRRGVLCEGAHSMQDEIKPQLVWVLVAGSWFAVSTLCQGNPPKVVTVEHHRGPRRGLATRPRVRRGDGSLIFNLHIAHFSR